MNAPFVDPIARNPLTVEQITVVRTTWPQQGTHICLKCGDIPRGNPSGENEWVCLFCGTSTRSPHIYFKERIIAPYRAFYAAAV